MIYPNPGFPIYESMIEFVEAKPVPVALREELDFRLDVTELIEKISDNTRLIILNSPNNPTGSVLTRQDIEKLADATRDLNLFILSDEIYSRILYEGEHISIASFPGMKDKTIILDGFSKTYAMTGWRLGYGVMTASLAQQLGKLMINSNSCTAAFTQMAGIEALRGDQISSEEMVNVFRRRRDRVVELLNEIDGVTCRTPKGAFMRSQTSKPWGGRRLNFSDNCSRRPTWQCSRERHSGNMERAISGCLTLIPLNSWRRELSVLLSYSAGLLVPDAGRACCPNERLSWTSTEQVRR